ncbi:MAG: shikimate kinase, partial [Candidatus Omnitrophota bacterium]
MKNIYLVGFMATGKTAVAKVLASRLNLKLVDMDAEIEEKEKMP